MASPEPTSRLGQLLRQRWVPVALTAIAVLAPFAPLLVPDARVIENPPHDDYTTYQLPMREFARQEFLAGRFPCWVPNLVCGLPLHAGQQVALCYPLVTGFVIPLGAPYGSKISIFFHLALCFFGQYLLARRIGLSPGASCLAGAVAMLGAFSIVHLMEGHLMVIFAYALGPWFFLALLVHLENPGARSCFGLSLVSSLLALAGHPQLPYYFLAFGFLLALGSLAWGAARVHRLRCVAWTAAAIAITLLVASIQLAPTAELLANARASTERGTVEYADQFSMEASDFLLFAWPNAKGNPFLDIPEFHPGYPFFHERIAYVGVLPLLLGLAVFFERRPPRWAICLACGIALCVLVALGKHAPFFEPLCAIVPGLVLFRCPARILSVATIMVALLAGKGADSFVQGFISPTRTQLIRRCAVALVLLLGIASLINEEFCSGQLRGYWDYATSTLLVPALGWVALLLGVAVALFLCRVLRERNRWACYLILLSVAVVDLFANNVVPFRLTAERPVEISEGKLQGDRPIRFCEHHCFESILTLRHSGLVGRAICGGLGLLGTNEGGPLPAATERLFEAILKNPNSAIPASACGYEYCPTDDRWVRLEGALPRIRLYPRETEQGADLIGNRPLQELSAADLERIRDYLSHTEDKAELVEQTSQRVHIRVQASRDVMLVLADTYYPGWKCLVDGVEERIWPAHGVFRGVNLTAGSHDVVFQFSPRSLWIGGALSALGCAILAGLACAAYWPEALKAKGWLCQRTAAR